MISVADLATSIVNRLRSRIFPPITYHQSLITFLPDCSRSRTTPGATDWLRPYFLGSHLSQFLAYSSTLSLVTGINSPLTKLAGGFLFSAALAYSRSTEVVPHS